MCETTVQDDPNLEDYNVKSRVDEFVAAALNQARKMRRFWSTLWNIRIYRIYHS